MEDQAEQELIDSKIRSLHNRETASEDGITIENTPPFFDYLRPFISTPLETVLKDSRRYEKQYLAWQSVRYAPASSRFTGFEGYFIGTPPENIREQIIEIGKHSLQNLNKDPLLKQEVLKTLTEEKISIKALRWLNAELGSITAKLHPQVSQNPESSNFKSSLYEKLTFLPGISYKIEPHKTVQTYKIPSIALPSHQTNPTSPDSLNDPLLYMSLIGKVGHPLVRASLRNIEHV